MNDVPRHFVNGQPLGGPLPAGSEHALFGMGCFWGAERRFWETPGVLVTSVGFAGGVTPSPSYEMVRTGRTGHAEVVRVVYDPKQISYNQLLKVFFESHDPTQGMRQGNDIGTQYRSAIYHFSEAQRQAAEAALNTYQQQLRAAGLGPITTELRDAPAFYEAEEHHQQYLAKNPDGYCELAGCGVPLKLAELQAGEQA